MTTAGWIIMIVSNVGVIAAAAWCLYRVLTLPPVEAESLHAPPAIDTHDTTDAD
jgi:hypothetical protein